MRGYILVWQLTNAYYRESECDFMQDRDGSKHWGKRIKEIKSKLIEWADGMDTR